MKLRYLLSIFALCLMLAPTLGRAAETAAQNDTQSITGFWMTQDRDAVVEFYPCDDMICGRFHWLQDDSAENPSFDDHNRDPDKRRRPLCGLQFLGDFKPQGQGRFTDGWIYSPQDGSTYSANLALQNADTLELRGYVLIPLLGQSQIWHRTGAAPACVRKTDGK